MTTPNNETAAKSQRKYALGYYPTLNFMDAVESARSKVDENGEDQDVLEAISRMYYSAWVANRNAHINQWPLAMLVVAAIRDAGYDVVKVVPNA